MFILRIMSGMPTEWKKEMKMTFAFLFSVCQTFSRNVD